MVDAGLDTVVMEVSSQALMLHRTQGFVFDYGILQIWSRIISVRMSMQALRNIYTARVCCSNSARWESLTVMMNTGRQ